MTGIASPLTGLAQVLSRPAPADAAGLAAAWYDQTVTFRIKSAGRRAKADIGGHLRRSFQGALGAGASEAAARGHPCTWDPPCALDVFRREQLRGPRGDGLPKPFVLRAWGQGADLVVTLRIFGMANDWSMVAAEALATGIRTILPWHREVPGLTEAPPIAARAIAPCRLDPATAPERVRLTFLSPVDATGRDIAAEPQTLITRLIRRVDAVSRWNGVALQDGLGAALAAHAHGLAYDLTELRFGHYESPNRFGQLRRDPVISGHLTLSGDLSPIWPLLHIGTRCHVGRKAVEGLGAYRLDLGAD